MKQKIVAAPGRGRIFLKVHMLLSVIYEFIFTLAIALSIYASFNGIPFESSRMTIIGEMGFILFTTLLLVAHIALHEGLLYLKHRRQPEADTMAQTTSHPLNHHALIFSAVKLAWTVIVIRAIGQPLASATSETLRTAILGSSVLMMIWMLAFFVHLVGSVFLNVYRRVQQRQHVNAIKKVQTRYQNSERLDLDAVETRHALSDKALWQHADENRQSRRDV